MKGWRAMVLLAALACVGLALQGQVDRVLGFALLMMVLGYLVRTCRQEATTADASARMHAAEPSAVPDPQHLPLALIAALADSRRRSSGRKAGSCRILRW